MPAPSAPNSAGPGLAGRALCLAIDAYRLLFGPVKAFLGLGGVCRFTPTCSHYCQEAIREHGALCGCGLGLRRLLRCHPWGPFGPDPVPRKSSRLCERRSALLS